MPSAGLEPAIWARERPRTAASDRSATGTAMHEQLQNTKPVVQLASLTSVQINNWDKQNEIKAGPSSRAI